MAEAGQSKQALENLKLWAGIFSCSRSPNTQFRELGPLRKAETFSIYTSQVQPPTEKGQFVPNHKMRTVSNIISIVILESVFFFFLVVVVYVCVCLCGGGSKVLFFPENSMLLGFPQLVSLWHVSILVFIFSCLSLSLFPVFFQERKPFSFFFFPPEYAET